MHSHFLYFHNGSIGDFLMTLYLMELLHEQNKERKLSVFVPKYYKECKELALCYPYVQVLGDKKQLVGLIGRGLVSVTPPTPGSVPLKVKMIAWLVSRGGGKAVGFNDGSIFNRLLFSVTLTYDTKELYHKTMETVARHFGNVTISSPYFHFKREEGVFEDFGVKKGEYIVLHPRGSDEKRSLPKKYLSDLLVCLKDYDGKILISGTQKDLSYYEDCVDGKRAISLVGVGFHDLANLLKEAELYIGPDTGITHLSALSGGKGIALTHPGSRYPWLPYYSDSFSVLFEGNGDPREQETFAFPSSQKVCEEIKRRMEI